MKPDRSRQTDRDEARVELLRAAVFLKGAAFVFFVAGVAYAFWALGSYEWMSFPGLLIGACAGIVCWVLSLMVGALADIERNTRKDSGGNETHDPAAREGHA